MVNGGYYSIIVPSGNVAARPAVVPLPPLPACGGLPPPRRWGRGRRRSRRRWGGGWTFRVGQGRVRFSFGGYLTPTPGPFGATPSPSPITV